MRATSCVRWSRIAGAIVRVAKWLTAPGGVGEVSFGPIPEGVTIDRLDIYVVNGTALADTLDIRMCSSPLGFDGGTPFTDPAPLPCALVNNQQIMQSFHLRHRVQANERYLVVQADTSASTSTYNAIVLPRFLGKGLQ